jgi:hypothetical protein
VIDPVSEVDDVTDDLSAARLRVEFEHMLRANAHLTEDDRAELREALAKLDREWPNAHRESMAATEAEIFGTGGMPRGYRQTRARLRAENGVNATTAARMRRERTSPPAGSPGPAGRSRRRARARGGRRELVIRPAGAAGDAGRQAARFTGADTLAGGIGDTALAAIRLGLLLALGYFLLSSRGSKGFTGVLGAITYGVRAFVAPVDPLHPPTGAKRPTSAGGIPIKQPKESGAHFDQRLGAYLQTPQAIARGLAFQRSQLPPTPVPLPSGAAIFGAPQLGGFPPTG